MAMAPPTMLKIPKSDAPERVKNQSGRVKRDEHRDAHLGIKVSCVFYDSCCCRRMHNTNEE